MTRATDGASPGRVPPRIASMGVKAAERAAAAAQRRSEALRRARWRGHRCRLCGVAGAHAIGCWAGR